MPGRPLTVLFMPESAFGPTNNCIGIGDVLRRRQAIGNLDGVSQRFVQSQAFAPDQPIQRLARDILHRDKINGLSIHLPGVDIENRDDVPVAQGRCGFGLL